VYFFLLPFGGMGRIAYLRSMASTEISNSKPMGENKPIHKSEKKPTMKRRMDEHDYTERCIYMITLAVEGREPVLGTLAGRVDAPKESSDFPHVALSPIGQCVDKALGQISSFYPQVKLIGRQIMPDHLHFILFVTERIPVPLGTIITGFKAGCRKAIRATAGNPAVISAAKPQGTQPAKPQGRPVEWSAVLQPSLSQLASKQPAAPSRLQQPGILWEHGYHDRVLYGKNQLEAMLNYIHDNPRRLMVKRSRSAYFRSFTIRIDGVLLYAYGNLELLKAPRLLSVKCSRSITDSQLQEQCSSLLLQKTEGGVLVSPFISKGERTIESAAIECGMPIIKLMENGFAPFFKPWGGYFDLCAAGKLLLLSPYEYHTERVALSRAVCMQLNAIAEMICRG